LISFWKRGPEGYKTKLHVLYEIGKHGVSGGLPKQRPAKASRKKFWTLYRTKKGKKEVEDTQR